MWKRTVLELGGYNPMIVLDDTELQYAVDSAIFGAFFHQGQICLNTRKIIVQRRLYGEFLEKFVQRARALPGGDPEDPKTIIGPLITKTAVEQVHARVEEARAQGAVVHTGGAYQGQVYAPTVLTDVPYSVRMSNEETFGPVVIVEPVDSDEEAVRVANRVDYGLTSSILTGNTYRGFEMAPRILAGIVNVNSSTVNDEIHAPMGGVRDSGWGRTGPGSIDDFTDLIWINARSTPRQYPF
jgi:acyl-CoA reductase-like NAD-dependent aldehyde dehydrogenase